MATTNLLLLPGDGIGPEVMAEVKKLIAWMNAHGMGTFEYEEGLVGGSCYDAHKMSITDSLHTFSMLTVMCMSGVSTISTISISRQDTLVFIIYCGELIRHVEWDFCRIKARWLLGTPQNSLDASEAPAAGSNAQYQVNIPSPMHGIEFTQAFLTSFIPAAVGYMQ